jgi:cysteine desulfurase/selenocysteine lyase
MNTRTNTPDGRTARPDLPPASTPLPALPADFPSEAELARWATELFDALPDRWEPGKTCPELIAARLAQEENRAAAAPPDKLPHSLDTTPKVGGTWQSGALPSGVSGDGGQKTEDKRAPATLARIASLTIALPDIRELGGWRGALERDPRDAIGAQAADYYFLENLPAPHTAPLPSLHPFPSGIRIPATVPGADTPPSGQLFDIAAIRRDFPILGEILAGGRALVWLDNAATTQKPQAVIDRLATFYAHENSNIHRAAHELAARATDAFEAARESARRFTNARSANEIVFVRGATEGINLVAQSWGRQNLTPGDEILITWLEHHANIVPWQRLAAQTGALLKVAPVDERGQVRVDEYEKLLGPRTRIVAFTQVSNALGTVTPAALMTRLAHGVGAKVLIDGAQSVSHLRTDVQALDADWFVFSGHKVFGPTGIGVLYGKQALLDATEPWQSGGNMIRDVTFERTLYHDAPTRFEAGTGNIADAVGLGAALEYVERIGIDNIARHEHDLLAHGTRLLEEIPGLRLIGTAAERAGVLSFVLDGYPVPEVGAKLADEGIAVRAGHHCAQPILRRFGLEATVRPSLALYNTHADLEALAAALWKLRRARGQTLR